MLTRRLEIIVNRLVPKRMAKLRKQVPAAIVAVALLVALCPSQAMAKAWEPVKSEPANTKSIVKDTEIEVKVAPGTLIVVANRQVQVKIFTILGQLVSSETVGPGTNRFQVSAHGVYIVKIADLTCKVAL